MSLYHTLTNPDANSELKMKATVEEQKAYWIKQLSGMSAAVTLPTDRERPPVSSFLRDTVSSAIAPEVCTKIRSLGSTGWCPTGVILLAALYAILHRYTASSDIVI